MKVGATGAQYVLALAMLAGLAFVDSVGLTSDPDIFWHLRTAKSVLETGGTLPQDIFSFSVLGGPWAHKDLIADLALYGGFAHFGYLWFVALKVIVVIATAVACHVMVRPRDRNPLVLLVAVGLVVDSFWIIERPNLFSMALFPLMFALVERARRLAGTEEPRVLVSALAPIVVLNAFWIWVHAFAILGHVTAFGFATYLFFARASPSPSLLGPPPSKRFVLAALAAAFVGALPWVATAHGRAALVGIRTIARSFELRQRILEWKQLGPAQLATAFPTAAVVVVVVAFLVGARLWRARRAGGGNPAVVLWHGVALLTLVVMVLDSVRWVPFVVTAAGLVLAVLMGEWLGPAGEGLPPRRMPRGVTLLVGLILFALLRWRQDDAPIAVGEDPAWSPRGAVDFVAANGLRGPVANSLEFGGYIMWSLWPAVHVLIDGRSHQVYDPDFELRCIRAEHDAATFAAMRAEDGVSWALGVNEPEHVTFGFLARDPEWWMVYWSETAAVYVSRRTHKGMATSAFRYVDPYDPPRSVAAAIAMSHGDEVALGRIFAEIRRMLGESPDSVRANLALLVWLDSLGPSGQTDRDAVLSHLVVATHAAPEVEAMRRALEAAHSQR